MKGITSCGIPLLFALFALSAPGLSAQPRQPPAMPPVFRDNADPMQVLESYPLGTLTKDELFSHHGGAHQVVKLPNGKEGWRYIVAGGPKTRAYTIVFDDSGRVIDVLYRDLGRREGLSALLLQLPELEPAWERHRGEWRQPARQ